jgi:hypothetical protein
MAPELAEIIEVWPSLPDSIKDAIKAIIAPYSKP